MIAVEVDYNYKSTARAAAKMDSRDMMLWRFGIVTIRANPTDIDLWIKEPALFQREIAYRLKESAKLVQYASAI